jgi:hypothetical protein
MHLFCDTCTTFYLHSTASRPPLEPTGSPFQCVMGPLSPELKKLGREAGYSPPFITEFKND